MSLPAALVSEFESKLAASKIGVATLQQLLYACLEGKVMVVPVDSVRNEHAWRRTLSNVKGAFGLKLLDLHGDLARSFNSESCQDSDFASSEDVVVLSNRNQESLSLNLNSCSSWEDPGLWTPKQPITFTSSSMEKKTTERASYEIFLREKKGVDGDPERTWRALTEDARKKYYLMAEKEKTMLEHLKRQHNIPHKIPNLSSNEASSEKTPPRGEPTTKKEPCTSSMKPPHPGKPSKPLPKASKPLPKADPPRPEKKRSLAPLSPHDNRPPRGPAAPVGKKADRGARDSRSSGSEKGAPRAPKLLSGSGSDDAEVETPTPGLRKGVQIFSNVGSNKKPQRLLSGSASSDEN